MLAEVREARPQLPVIVLTARTEIAQQGRSARPGRHRLRHQAVLVRGAGGARAGPPSRPRRGQLDPARARRLCAWTSSAAGSSEPAFRSASPPPSSTCCAFFMRHPGPGPHAERAAARGVGLPGRRGFRGRRASTSDTCDGSSLSVRNPRRSRRSGRWGTAFRAMLERARSAGSARRARAPGSRSRSRSSSWRPWWARFFAVYQRTGSDLRGQVDRDLSEDVSGLAQHIGTAHGGSAAEISRRAQGHINSQPTFGPASEQLLVVKVGGAPLATNEPELLGVGKEPGENTARRRPRRASRRRSSRPRRLLDDRPRGGRERPAAHPPAVHRRSRGGPDHGRVSRCHPSRRPSRAWPGPSSWPAPSRSLRR